MKRGFLQVNDSSTASHASTTNATCLNLLGVQGIRGGSGGGSGGIYDSDLEQDNLQPYLKKIKNQSMDGSEHKIKKNSTPTGGRSPSYDTLYSRLDLELIIHILEFVTIYMEHSYILREFNSNQISNLFGVRKTHPQRIVFLLFPSIELEIYDNDLSYKYFFPLKYVKNLTLADRRPRSSTHHFPQSCLYPFHGMKNLESLDIYSHLLEDEALKCFAHTENLKSLHIRGAFSISMSGLRLLMEQRPQLQRLKLGNIGIEHVDDTFCEHLSCEHSGITELQLPQHGVSSTGLELLISNSKLRILNLMENVEIAETNLSALACNNNLTDLTLSYNKLGDNEITQIARYGRNIKFLSISSLQSTVSPETIMELLQQTNFISLSIRHLKPAIIDSSIFNISSNLQALDVSLTCGNFNTSGDSIAEVISKNFKQLHFLSMRRCYLTDVGFMHLARLKSLRNLNVSYNDLTDDSIRFFVQENTTVEVLHVNSNKQITNYGYRLLACHPALVRLKLSGKIGNDALIHIFRNLKTCKSLHIDGFSKLSDLPFEYLPQSSLEHLSIIGSPISYYSAELIARADNLKDLLLDFASETVTITSDLLKILARSSSLHTLRLPQENFHSLTEGVKFVKLSGKQIIWH
ncbi:hypothetical protein FDP41_006468 [Naegleria fowleri]|uniref:Uncharacterized protein n=1 Tax=Naegleria fowleri TaxID=5763 RepID=A0A6A5BI54_NAEFO|nr:uncharacterized protein FDP41_006978 [Naegleria fowleri]XP_044559149.1 uncharacterized protein FDP41_006468 [Naegleria fowleri]KAF0973995.1 hypothetical protein FDP41_006978 [Naegleria fowleri]KAF0974436.1 hypothetical protein FDP41_006468 [Naegleria fowleri]CAG4710567.1 unnamed protein product [Naegleria fowleri]